jgi:Skp family chaperone for outer membrane proteins
VSANFPNNLVFLIYWSLPEWDFAAKCRLEYVSTFGLSARTQITIGHGRPPQSQQGVLNVNTTLRSATIWAITVLVGLCANVTTVQAQVTTQQASIPVAVIDISVIFKDHPRFKAMMADWKKDFQAAQTKSRTGQQTFQEKQRQLAGLSPGSQGHKSLEDQLMKMESDLRYDVNRIKKEFMEREVKIYHEVFNEVAGITETFARRHRILLVLRYNSAKVTGEQRSVYQGINRNVVFQDNIDITANIQTELKRLYPPKTNGGAGGNAGRINNIPPRR